MSSLRVDEYENVLCPLPVLAIDRPAMREWGEHERGPMPAPVVEPCGEMVVVTWEGGLLIDSGKRRPSALGRPQQVLTITEHGVAEARKLGVIA